MVFKCKICGGNLEVKNGQRIATCAYCGVQQTLPKTENDKMANLYDRANHFLRNNEYDKAEAIFETILNEDPTDGEAYWSLLMCEFGVEYVKDPRTENYIPTCNRTKPQAIFSNENYKKALENSNEEQKEIYEKQAEKINNIQKKILELSNKEKPYDVFICYKEKDKNNERTEDSVLAQEIYEKLTQQGLRVFFSRITLEDKLGTEYEPYIYGALSSAKVMVVVGTSKENLESPWVRNEWSRFLSMGKNKTLIPCFKNMDVHKLPEEFAHLQAQDMSKIGFMQDLIYGVKKIIKGRKKELNISFNSVLIILAVIITIVLIAMAITNIMNKEENTETQENKTSQTVKKETRKILIEDDYSFYGQSFNMTIEEFKKKWKEKLGDESPAMIVFEGEGVYLEIGTFYDNNMNLVEKPKDNESYTFEGISISYNEEGTHYINSVYCEPPQYGSGDPTPLNECLKLYKYAKQILGSDTDEWKELVKNGDIKETIKDYQGNTLSNNVDFQCGMTKSLYPKNIYE